MGNLLTRQTPAAGATLRRRAGERTAPPRRPSARGSATRARILETSLRLFNENGYVATALAEIASAVGIAPGNLSYHFPTKRDLAGELEARARNEARARHSFRKEGPVFEDYVEGILVSMDHAWDYRFLMRNTARNAGGRDCRTGDPDLAADLAWIRRQLRRMARRGYFRREFAESIPMLARSLFVVSRYWMDHLHEMEGLDVVSRVDQRRGVEHHLSLLRPCLTAGGRREFEDSVRAVLARRRPGVGRAGPSTVERAEDPASAAAQKR